MSRAWLRPYCRTRMEGSDWLIGRGGGDSRTLFHLLVNPRARQSNAIEGPRQRDGAEAPTDRFAFEI